MQTDNVILQIMNELTSISSMFSTRTREIKNDLKIDKFIYDCGINSVIDQPVVSWDAEFHVDDERYFVLSIGLFRENQDIKLSCSIEKSIGGCEHETVDAMEISAIKSTTELGVAIDHANNWFKSHSYQDICVKLP